MIKKLLMLALTGFAVAMAVPTTRAEIAGWTVPVTDAIGEKLVPRRIEVMADQLDVRLGRGEGLPERFDGWLRRDYSGSELDPWGNLYFLAPGRRDYTVGSMGADGVQGTADDMTVTRSLPGSRR